MSLRVRLIVVFFLLSVVPLGAVTFYSYTSNVRAVRDAATRESDLLAGELSQRMQLVTAELSERVEHLMDIPNPPATTTGSVPQVTQNEKSSGGTQTAAQGSRAATTTTTTASKPKPAAAVPVAPATPAPAPAPVAPTAPRLPIAPGAADAVAQTYDAQVAQALGEAAMLLNNVELRGMGRGQGRGYPRPSTTDSTGRSGRGYTEVPPGAPHIAIPPPMPPGVAPPAAPGVTPQPPPGVMPQPSPGVTPQTPPGATAQPSPGATPSASSPGQRGGSNRYTVQRTRPPGGAGGRGADANSGTSGTSSAGTGTAAGTAAGTGGAAGSAAADAANAASDAARLTIDLAPIRREILKQIVPDGQLDNLTPEERQRVAREVNQRMLGIAQGLQLGAAGLQKKAADAEKEAADAQAKSQHATDATAKTAKTAGSNAKTADANAKASDMNARTAETSKSQSAASHATPPESVANHATPATPPPMKKKTEITGNHLGVMVEQNGQVVEQIGAEINMPQVLATVFSTTRRDRGEVPFAISKDGKIHAPTDEDRKTVENLKLAVPPDGQATTTLNTGDWIVVMTADPSGSGLHFGIAKPVADSMNDLRKTAARNASFGLGFIALAIVGIVPLSTRLTRNLSTLTEGVDRIAHGDYSARVPLKTTDEIGRLATAFNRMATDVEAHQRAAVEQERVKRELELGRQIQHEMLPHEPLRLGLTEIKGVSVPAREVGGDFFNYFELSDHRVAVLVGDVSGKGVGAALLMANIQASLRTRLALGQDLSAIADAIDRDVDANSPGPVYATLFVGILNPATRMLEYVNAGHFPQYALCSRGLERMESTGLPVGLLSGRGYTARNVQLAESDMLFFYTDGVVEAENPSGDMFGRERLETTLTSTRATTPDEVLSRVEQAVKSFRGTAEPADDETMMAVRVG
jgi:serine phosphatase RsbU (regulator of sigma subunit)